MGIYHLSDRQDLRLTPSRASQPLMHIRSQEAFVKTQVSSLTVWRCERGVRSAFPTSSSAVLMRLARGPHLDLGIPLPTAFIPSKACTPAMPGSSPPHKAAYFLFREFYSLESSSSFGAKIYLSVIISHCVCHPGTMQILTCIHEGGEEFGFEVLETVTSLGD